MTKTGVQVMPERLREARDRLHLSLADVARKSGVTRAAVSQYEHGKSKPSLPVLTKIAACFRSPVEYFLVREIPPPSRLEPDALELLEARLENCMHNTRQLIEIATMLSADVQIMLSRVKRARGRAA